MPKNRKVYNSNLYYKMQYLMNKEKTEEIQNQTEFIFNNKMISDSILGNSASVGIQAKLDEVNKPLIRNVKTRAVNRDKPRCVALVI